MHKWVIYSFKPLNYMFGENLNISLSEEEYKTFAVLLVSNYILYELALLSYLMFCVCVSYDLWASIKNPLYPSSKRILKYCIWTLVMIIVLFIAEYNLINGSYFKAYDVHDDSDDLANYI